MPRETIIKHIQDCYPTFTNVEKVIADFFLSNPNCVDYSSKYITKKLFVSEAALSRFSKKCGFNGYREFIFRYKEKPSSQSHVEGYNQIKYVYQVLLNDMYKYLDESQIIRFCDLIKNSNSIVIFGMGSSYLAGLQMKYKFLRLGLTIDIANEIDDIKIRSTLQRKNNLVIGISLSAKQEIISSLKHAKIKNAKTALITASNNKFDFIDEILKVPSIRGLNTGHIISPQFPILVLLDICYFYYLKSNKIEFDNIQQSTVEILNH